MAVCRVIYPPLQNKISLGEVDQTFEFDLEIGFGIAVDVTFDDGEIFVRTGIIKF